MALKEPRVEWLRAGDAEHLASRIWHGRDGRPVLVYLHGIEGHSQWFANTAAHLNNKGYSIVAQDRRGSGMNAEMRGHIRSYKLLLADIESLLHHTAERFPKSPVILFGNCWGGKPAALIARRDYRPRLKKKLPRLSGLILTSPALFTRIDLSIGLKARIAFDVLRGGQFQMRETHIPILAQMFTDNAEYIEYIENDPLRLKAATSRFFFENFLVSLRAIGSAKHIELPVLLIQSGSDQIVEIERVKSWFAQVGSEDKTLELFPDAAHSLDFDPAWFKDYTELLDKWMSARMVSR